MKKTGRMVYLSGVVRPDLADYTLLDGSTTLGYFQNVLVDERVGYAYKVTFAATYPNVTNQTRAFNTPYGIFSLSRRELLRMSEAEARAHLGYTRSLAALNRNIGVVNGDINEGRGIIITKVNYQSQYVIKGDAMVTQAIAIGVGGFNNDDKLAVPATYYIELEEYEVSSDEEILLILNERAQNVEGLSD